MNIRCPYCKSILKLREAKERKVKKIKCPKCQRIMKLKEEEHEIRANEPRTIITSAEPLLEKNIPPGLTVRLEEVDGDGRTYTLKKSRTVIGRIDGDININDSNVSKKHMVIEVWSRDNIYLRDLSSTNGTFLNGARIMQSKLKDGDIIRIGSTKLKVIIK